MKFFYRVLEHKIFHIGLVIKAIYGALETLAGTILVFVSSRYITTVVRAVFGAELLEDPKDFLGNLFMNFAHNLSLRTKAFLAIFMIAHGLINIGIVMALLHKKLWVFPVVSSVLALLIVYQTYQFVHNHSITLLIITFVDLTLFGLLGVEYHRLKRKIASS